MAAQEAAPEGFANGRLRRLLAFNKSYACAGVKIGDAALCYKSQSKKSAPRRRGPDLISGTDDTAATAKCQSQISKVARFLREKERGGDRCGGC